MDEQLKNSSEKHEPESNKTALSLLRKFCNVPRNSFINKTGRIVAVSAILGFSVLGGGNLQAASTASQSKAKYEQRFESNQVFDVAYDDVVMSTECEGNFTCSNGYDPCTVYIPCFVYIPCETIQVPCIYGVYLPEL